MIFPNRFPFDVLDPSPAFCAGCGCDLDRPDGQPQESCHYPAECECHEMWRADTDELEKRALWGDR